MRATEWTAIAGRVRKDFPRMVLPDDTVESWFEHLAPYPGPLVEQACRRMAFAGDRVQPSLAMITDYLLKSIEESHEKAKHSEQRVQWEQPRIEPEQEARWVKALAFVLSSPKTHPARVWNAEVTARRSRGETVDGEEHLVGLELRARQQPLTGAGAAKYRLLTKQGKIGVLRALAAS